MKVFKYFFNNLSITKTKVTKAFKIIVNYIHAINVQKVNLIDKTATKFVFFDLKDIRLGPYYYSLIFAFHNSGFQIFINNNFWFIGNCTKVAREIFRLSNVKIVYYIPEGISQLQCWYVHDRFVSRPLKGKWLKYIRINTDVYSPKPVGQFYTYMPFPISPHLYVNGIYQKINEFRLLKSNTRVFFSGNLDKEAYKQAIFNDFFKKIDRVTLVDVLIEQLNEDEIIIVESKKDLEKCKLLSKPSFELFNWTWSPKESINLDIRVKNEEWLEKLASSSFFLCAPGIRMPLCFNCVEALSVGTIPILEYPEYFDPPLKHMENAIVFSGKHDLVEKIRLALHMDQVTIDRLSHQAIQYYDKYLHPKAIVEKLNRSKEYNTLLYIHAEQASYDDHLISREIH